MQTVKASTIGHRALPDPIHIANRNILFRVGVVLFFAAVLAAIRLAKAVVFPEGGDLADGWFDQILRWGSVTWIVLIPWAVADVAGWLLYRRHSPASDGAVGLAIGTPVVYRIVCRGDQPDVVRATVHEALRVMAMRPLFPYSIEVVSDVPVQLPVHRAVTNLVVPDGYGTSNGATHKARALHYALDASPTDDETWILHLDEESHITPEVVEGIRAHIVAEETSGDLRVGQGLILYHRGLEGNKLLTMADSVRVADDMGRFHLQYRLHRVLFGLHGSFVLVRRDVEARVGWDFEPAACTTEDTMWGLRQMDAGTRFAWVDGCVVEQSPRTPTDFLKQRRRWFVGMWWSALHADVRRRHRAMLAMAMTIWTVGWMNLLYSYLHVFSGVAVPGAIGWLGDVVFTTYLVNYVMGMWVSLADRGDGATSRAKYVALQLALLPVYTALEAGAVLYALVSPERGFHVVRKGDGPSETVVDLTTDTVVDLDGEDVVVELEADRGRVIDLNERRALSPEP